MASPETPNSERKAFRNISPNVIVLAAIVLLVLGLGARYVIKQRDIDSQAKFYYQQGVDSQAAGKMLEAKAAFESVVQLPTSTLTSSAKQKLEDVKAAIAKEGNAAIAKAAAEKLEEQRRREAELAETEKAHEQELARWNRAHPDPAPPVREDKILAAWWYDKDALNKTYVFIEDTYAFTQMNLTYAAVSLPGGQRLTVRCVVEGKDDGSGIEAPAKWCPGLTSKVHEWIRVTMGEVFRFGPRAPAKEWRLIWHDGNRIEYYNVQQYCSPRCTDLSQKIDEELATDADRKRRGLD